MRSAISAAQALARDGDVLADSEVEPALGRANFIDGFDASAQMLGVPVFEINRRSVREDDRVMRRIMQHPDLHVGGIERVADVDRVVEQDRRAIMLPELILDPSLAIGAHPLQRLERNGASQWLIDALAVEVGRLARVLEDFAQLGRAPARCWREMFIRPPARVAAFRSLARPARISGPVRRGSAGRSRSTN